MTARSPVLELTRVEYAYRRTAALRGAGLIVNPGEVVAVTGPSGCGKSTLLHVAAGILTPQAGQVRTAGHDLAALDEAGRCRLRRQELGIVLQFGQLVPDLPIVDNVALPLLLNGRPVDEARTAAWEWLHRVQLEEHGNSVPAEMSAGQVQRAAVARALIAGPTLVLADEPTGSTDTATGRSLLDLLLHAVRDRGAGLLLVTHDNAIAARADREVRLRDGLVEHDVSLA